MISAIHVSRSFRRKWRRAVLDADIVLGEDALFVGAHVRALPPLGVAVLGDGDVVAGLEVQVARVGVAVPVEGDDVGELGGVLQL